jgi:hypothetical protein
MPPKESDAFVWASDVPADPPASVRSLRASASRAATPTFPAASSGKGLLERSGGRLTRRMTMYLDPALARRVLLHCAETGEEISDVAAQALEQWLSSQAAR